MSEFIIDMPDDYSTNEWDVYYPDERDDPMPIGEAIVRCRDCKHARHYHPLDWRTGKPHETVEEWYCQWHSNAEGASEIEPNGYCAWGERKVVE